MEEENQKLKDNKNISLCSNSIENLLPIIKFHYFNRNKKQEKEDKDQWTNSKSARFHATSSKINATSSKIW